MVRADQTQRRSPSRVSLLCRTSTSFQRMMLPHQSFALPPKPPTNYDITGGSGCNRTWRKALVLQGCDPRSAGYAGDMPPSL